MFPNHSEKVLEKPLRVDGELPTNLSNELQGTIYVLPAMWNAVLP